MLCLPEATPPPILGQRRTRRGKPGGPIMAKKKSASPVVKPKPAPLPNVVSMRGRTEWREWLTGLAEKCRTTPSSTIDRALAELAERVDYPEPPPRT